MWFMVKVPLPVHPVAPVRVQVPVIVPPVTAPCNVNTLLGEREVVVIVNPNWPVTFPLKSPDRANEPVSVVGVVKQEPEVVKVKFTTFKELPEPCVKLVVKANSV